ncbi:MAG: hypothetical protein HY692_10080, partial [Cyanobacteria bacterium NC_groundwater_1444_Ag_S-0.65um_54_12]|nr:hypothetical protein [Cyanobacteria bacterium NC_groundwater_1444_Ag_S-0.65um_54_12]
MMVPLATVLLAVPDQRSLAPLLESLFEQNVKDIEILVISPVHREDARWLPGDLPIKNLLVSANSAPGMVMNLGAHSARGHYLVTLASEARLRDNRWLFRLLSPFLDAKVAVVSGKDYNPDLLSGPCSSYYLELADYLLTPEYGPSQDNGAFRLDLVIKWPFDETLPRCVDKEWTFRILQAGYRVVMDYEARVELLENIGAESQLRALWENHQAIASFLRNKDTAALLWKLALAKRNFGEVLRALMLWY